MSTLVIVPTYNEATNILHTLDEIRLHLPSTDVLVVDDSSPDGTGTLVAARGLVDPRVSLLSRADKSGLAGAYRAGFEYALAQGYDIVIEMDADGSHPAQQLPALVAALSTADLAIGSRWGRKGSTTGRAPHRHLLSRLASTYVRWMLGSPVSDVTSGFRAFRAEALRAIDTPSTTSKGYSFQIETLHRAHAAGLAITEVPITFAEREHGQSKMSAGIVMEAFTRVAHWRRHPFRPADAPHHRHPVAAQSMDSPTTPTASIHTGAPSTGRRTIRTSLQEFGRAPRVMGVDVARGLAVFGMIGVHVGVATTFNAGNPLTWTALVEGRSSILFAVVAGISVAFATGMRTRPTGEALRSARLRMAGRALAVLAIGLALELLGSSIAVILPIYGLLFLIVIPFLGLRRRTLIVTATALALAGPTLIALLRALTLGGSGAGVDFLIAGSYPLTVWLPLILAGMAVGRSSLRETRTAVIVTGLGVLLAVGGYGVGSAVSGSADSWASGAALSGGSASFPGTTPGDQVNLNGKTCITKSDSVITCFSDEGSTGGSMGGAGEGSATYFERLGASDLGTSLAGAWGVSPHSGGTFEIIGSGGFALAVVGACILLARPLRWVLLPVAAVGSMPLTAYSAHVISFAVLVSPIALAPSLVSFDGDGSSTSFWLACIGALLVGCTAWALTRGRGPLERVTAWAARAVDRPRAS